MKSEYRNETTLSKEQIGGSGSTWSWFACMTTIMEGTANGRGAPRALDQGTIEIIEDDEHELLDT